MIAHPLAAPVLSGSGALLLFVFFRAFRAFCFSSHLFASPILCYLRFEDSLVRALIKVVQCNPFVLYVDFKTLLIIARHIYPVAYLAFDTDIRYEAMHGLRIDARQITGVWIAIGIAIGYIKQKGEVMPFRRVTENGWCSRCHNCYSSS